MALPGDPITLRFLGAGGAFSRRYGTTCSLLSVGAAKWLIDCGRQAPDQLHEAGLSWHEIEGQLVTHVHGDHVFGLEDFAFKRFFEDRPQAEAVMHGGPKPKLVGHAAVLDEVWEVLAPSLRYLKKGDDLRAGTLADFFEIVEASQREPARANPWAHAERFEVASMQVTARESAHVPGKPSCSLELHLDEDVDGQIAWWSGDCTVDGAKLEALEPRCTVFFHDCTFVDYPGQVHGAFSLIEKLPRKVLDKLVIMHHEDDLELHRARVEALGVRIALPDSRWDLRTGQEISGPAPLLRDGTQS